jgi:hypothetical protein
MGYNPIAAAQLMSSQGFGGRPGGGGLFQRAQGQGGQGYNQLLDSLTQPNQQQAPVPVTPGSHMGAYSPGDPSYDMGVYTPGAEPITETVMGDPLEGGGYGFGGLTEVPNPASQAAPAAPNPVPTPADTGARNSIWGGSRGGGFDWGTVGNLFGGRF